MDNKFLLGLLLGGAAVATYLTNEKVRQAVDDGLKTINTTIEDLSKKQDTNATK